VVANEKRTDNCLKSVHSLSNPLVGNALLWRNVVEDSFIVTQHSEHSRIQTIVDVRALVESCIACLWVVL
jgi:hypothetical protein